MDGVLGRLYRRMGSSYSALLVLSAIVLAAVFPLLVVYVATVRYLGMSTAEFAHVARLAVIGVEIGTLGATVAILRASWPALRWMAGAKGAEEAAAGWAGAVGLPRLHATLAPLPIALGCIPSIVAIENIAHPAWYSVIAIASGSLVVVGLGISVHMVTCEAILRPVLLEIDAAYPQGGIETHAEPKSLRRRIVGSSLLVVWMSTWLATGLVSRTSDPIEQLTVTVVAGLVVAVTFGLVLTIALSQSLFGPLRDLVNATRRVKSGDLNTRVPLVAHDEMSELTRSFNEMVGGMAEREALRSALGAYVEPGIADRLLAEGEFLKGEDVHVTVMFVDIVGFSARAEWMAADQVCAELNDFFGLIIPVVEKSGGHVNKLIGDGLMAVFGTPIAHDDHADRALDAACTIQDHLWERYRGSLKAGVGLNSGFVTVGTTGGGSKLDFTVIGDVVNVAARVEAMTRETGDSILLTETTRHILRNESAALASRGTTPIKGRSEPVSLFAVASRIPA